MIRSRLPTDHLARLAVVGRQSKLKAERRAQRQREACAAQERRVLRQLARERGAADGRRRGCLICREADGGFTAEEHIVPESLGNTEHVLPPGVVCDRCNHDVCAPLDEALCSFAPIQVLRTIHQQPTKSGKLPSIKFDNGRMESTGPGELYLELSSAKWHRDLPSPPGVKLWEFTGQRSNETTPSRLSRIHRALVKQALEFVWIDRGEHALSGRFDRERSIILDGDHKGFLLIPRRVTFEDVELQTGLHYIEWERTSDGHPLLGFVAWFWGVPIASDTLYPVPTIDVPDDFIVLAF